MIRAQQVRPQGIPTPTPHEQVTPSQVQAQWLQAIMPIMMGVMALVFIAGMVRDLFTGKPVLLPESAKESMAPTPIPPTDAEIDQMSKELMEGVIV